MREAGFASKETDGSFIRSLFTEGQTGYPPLNIQGADLALKQAAKCKDSDQTCPYYII